MEGCSRKEGSKEEKLEGSRPDLFEAENRRTFGQGWEIRRRIKVCGLGLSHHKKYRKYMLEKMGRKSLTNENSQGEKLREKRLKSALFQVESGQSKGNKGDWCGQRP